MSKTFNEALALFVQQYKNLDYIPIIIKTEFKDGYDFEYSEYTRDHQNAEFVITYQHPGPTKSKKFECNIDLMYYNGINTNFDYNQESGFTVLVQDIAELMK
jgi:hypothetical protein